MQNNHPFRALRFIPAALAALFLLAAPAMADVVRTVSTEYYLVEGTKPAIIYKNLRHQSPLNEGDSTYQANTRTDIRTTYKVEQRGDQCRITDVVVYLHLTYLYPKLAHSVDFETRKWWKKFSAQLEKHENIHGEISTKAAYKLSDALQGMAPGDCYNYKSAIKVKIKQIMDKMKQDQVDYDNLTEHGLKQQRNFGQYP